MNILLREAVDLLNKTRLGYRTDDRLYPVFSCIKRKAYLTVNGDSDASFCVPTFKDWRDNTFCVYRPEDLTQCNYNDIDEATRDW
ncbi:hypothetical protein [Brevibacillus sp. 179-C9.3 HS]|uniref:hypothetical protein n=1 Tax=unclassified Brevibacillus TaxID=2684853 RepID=UPI0039A1AB63